MTYKGHIKNGFIVLDDPVSLPEGVAVEVALRPESPAAAGSFHDRFADIIGSCPDLPADMARNHDHHLHGQEPK